MRELTIKQKNLLKKWFKSACPTEKEKIIFQSTPKIRSIDDLSVEQIKVLENINDTEILYQNINRFLKDLWINNEY